MNSHDRVRELTTSAVNQQIDTATETRLQHAATALPSHLNRYITDLETEWDFDRVLETEAAAVGLTGLLLALAIDRRLLVIPGAAAAAMLIHAVFGPYPLLPLFRRAGVRTRHEIDQEKYAAKALRGDFEMVRGEAANRAAAAWRAVLL